MISFALFQLATGDVKKSTWTREAYEETGVRFKDDLLLFLIWKGRRKGDSDK